MKLILAAKAIHNCISVLPKLDGSITANWNYLNEEERQVYINVLRKAYNYNIEGQHPVSFYRLWSAELVSYGWFYGDKFDSIEKKHPLLNQSFYLLPKEQSIKFEFWSYLSKQYKPFIEDI